MPRIDLQLGLLRYTFFAISKSMDRIPEPETMDIEERARAYADADFLDVNEAFADRLAEVADFSRPALVADLGTGAADIALLAASRAPSWRVVGVDMSLPMLRIGAMRRRESQISNASLVLTDAKVSAFPDAVFDVVYSNSLLHHVADPVALWREIRRIAKPSAAIFVRDLFRPHDAASAYCIVEQYAPFEPSLLKEDFYNSLLAAYTTGEVRAQLDDAGMTDLCIRIVTDRHIDIFGAMPHSRA